jgi:5-methyltetrahydrofolate--homocysteine methyltransferase
MKTVLSSATKTVVISPDDPFVIIGERINPTGRKKLAEEMRRFDMSRVRDDARIQTAAGAAMLDVNAGIPGADEPGMLKAAVIAIMETTDAPISIDSSTPEALEAALPAYKGKALVNSVTGEDQVLERLLPLVKKHGAAVIGIANDDTGISNEPEARLAVARKIVQRAADHGIPAEDVMIDPLCMPIGANHEFGRITFETMRLIREELGVNMSVGAGNVGFGLPDRPPLTASFILLGMMHGLTAAITNALEGEIARAVLAGDLMLGRDPFGGRWMAYYRKAQKAAAAPGTPRARTPARRPWTRRAFGRTSCESRSCRRAPTRACRRGRPSSMPPPGSASRSKVRVVAAAPAGNAWSGWSRARPPSPPPTSSTSMPGTSPPAGACRARPRCGRTPSSRCRACSAPRRPPCSASAARWFSIRTSTRCI